jgi:ketosteroid isomerase-like protein
MDEAIEMFGPPDVSGGDEAFRGRDGVRRGFSSWLGTWDSYRFEVRDLIDAGERVLASGWHTGRGRGSGVDVSEDFFVVWTVRSGRVVGLSMFRDRRAALEAAGLRE